MDKYRPSPSKIRKYLDIFAFKALYIRSFGVPSKIRKYLDIFAFKVLYIRSFGSV